MINHVALFRFAEGTSRQTIDAITTALRALPDLIPEIADYRVGPDLKLAEGSWDYAVVASFEDEGRLDRYRSHPDHVAVVEELIRPSVASSARVQFES